MAQPSDPGPNPAFDHVLLTRFSAVLMQDAPPAPAAWLRYRLGFFYDACLPSVQAQRGMRPFQWLVLFDDRCGDDFRETVTELAEGTFTPIWTHQVFRRDSFAAPVAERTAATHLITTRLDSDDALAVDYLAAVQAQFSGQDRLFVNFPRGLQIDRSGAVYRTDIVSNPFVSLIERRRPGTLPETVYVAKHARVRGHAPLRQVRAPVMWAQVVHGGNVSNIVNGPQVAPGVVAERFDFDLGYAAGLRGTALRRAQLRHLAGMGRLWAGHPGEFTKWVEAAAITALGTRTWPPNSGDSLSDWIKARTRPARSRANDARWAAKERLNATGRSALRPVAGDVTDVLGAERVVVLAEWSRGRELRPSALAAASAYAAAGWPTLIVAARDRGVPLRRTDVPAGVAVVRRRNSAYDFGSWRDALATYPELAAKPHVILTNDSLEGPVGPLDELLRRIETGTAPVWAATQALAPVPHLQSYLLAFRDGVLATPELAGFFAAVAPQPSKKLVIRTYEIGLSRLLEQQGVSAEVGWTHGELGLAPHTEPSLAGWQPLVDHGFPFVKRVLLRDSRFVAVRPTIEALLRRVAGTGH